MKKWSRRCSSRDKVSTNPRKTLSALHVIQPRVRHDRPPSAPKFDERESEHTAQLHKEFTQNKRSYKDANSTNKNASEQMCVSIKRTTHLTCKCPSLKVITANALSTGASRHMMGRSSHTAEDKKTVRHSEKDYASQKSECNRRAVGMLCDDNRLLVHLDTIE